ncbi:PD40 domain-containing protein [Micromonospora krabiensis]|uniref:WD40-like Beta Propeller Repeat n=1 Tax=Micromonospora krabiensis TaxID=307121 RepID=A0A1C3MYS1_9ACTN|nr:PD40 domain-containing protein [Micromonospora krabiensis]SBV25483.1 WD40-like Beta Propeller Repeat [Micromonospora krabiensis]
MPAMSTRIKLGVATAAAVALGAVAVGYAVAAAPAAAPEAAAGTVTLTPGPRLLTITDRHVSSVAAADPSGTRTVSSVECLRVYAAAGTGVCLGPKTPWQYQLVVLDSALRPTRTVEIPGLPNRARVSASGRMVSWTTFVGGDSYTASGFSTRTGIVDTRDGSTVMSLEEFAVRRDGRPYRSADVNFWGVTFTADDNVFYATMSTAGKRYLVRGDLSARRVETLKENVECPSLSPDGTRLAFKEAVDADPAKGWRLSVLDLASLRVTATAETASVDDQAAWLDGATLAYTLRQEDGRPDVWSVPADGSGQPELLVPGAESPSPLT